MAKILPSLDLIAEEVRTERATHLGHFESLDTKAGIVIGFVGVLVALGAKPTGFQIAGAVSAAVAALAAMSSFASRRYPAIDIERLRDLYAGADPAFTMRSLSTRASKSSGSPRLDCDTSLAACCGVWSIIRGGRLFPRWYTPSTSLEVTR